MAKILLVEDNEMIRDMLLRFLMLDDHQIVIAVDGAQAVTIAETERPDLIVMDMRLPVLDGWEATTRIKSIPGIKATPIIALTAHAMAEDRKRSFAVGCDDYETKPVEFLRLSNKIKTLLRKTAG
jgi:two-component system cell cycle response regulator DivK